MRYYGGNLFFLFYTALVCCNTVPASNSLEQQLLQLFKIWRTGNVELLPFKLPPLNKIVTIPFEGEYSENGIKMSFSTSEMELTGLDSFVIESLQASDETLEASIAVRIVNATLFAEQYKLSGWAYYVYPLKGSGVMKVFCQDIRLFSSLQLGSNGTSLRMEKLQFDYTVQKVQGELTGSSWPINKVLKSGATSILASYHDVIVEAVVRSALPYANDFLMNLSLDELLNLFIS